MGYIIPVLFAIVFIPPVVKGLGEERFGLLSLSWVVIGYFSFFDFGIGKSLTKVIAEKVGSRQHSEIPGIFWNSFLFMLIISAGVATVSLIFAPVIIDKYLSVSNTLKQEAVYTLYALSIAIPVVTTTTAIRGVLEAYQEFGKVNFLRTLLGIATFIGPYIVLSIVNSLFWIIIFLLVIRIIVWLFYLLSSFKVNTQLKKYFSLRFKISIITPVLKMSMWITIVNTVGPIILYSDRFLIGSLVSVSAVTFYSTPYEMITKLLLLPSALVGVLFPAFSASFSVASEKSKLLFKRGFKFIFILVFPLVLFFVTFAYEIMYLWLGIKFANNSALVLQLLALGILFSSISSIPNNYFQGVGKPQVPAILNLIELPFYILGMYLSIKFYSIYGAAFFWMIAAVIDSIINYIIAQKKFGVAIDLKYVFFSLIFILISLLLGLCVDQIMIKLAVAIPIVFVILYLNWNIYLSDDEKNFVLSMLKSKLGKRINLS